MISKDELREQARAFDLTEANVQRDYVFGWLIAGIFNASELREQVVLKGGNALRKAYLPSTRFSDDLDLSSPSSVDGTSFLREFNAACEFASASTGIPFDLERNRLVDQHQIDRERVVYKFRLYFKDLLGENDHITISVRIDVTEFDQLYLPVQDCQLIHPYSDADACTAIVRCVKLEEALADKLKCLLQRRYAYDLFDLVYGAFVSRDVDVDRTELLNVFLRKTVFEASPHAARSLLLDLPLDVFRGYWGKVVCPLVSRLSFDDAAASLREGVASLFEQFGEGGGHLAYAFFPSALRNPILQAGSGRQLVRLRYDGVTRIVEPYSLAFKRRNDGVAREYLYVWDRTGGRSRKAGVKSLLHHKIEDLEVLEEGFEPRYPIELSKAGDRDQSGYFSQPNTGSRRRDVVTTARTRRARILAPGPTYLVQCNLCGKQFQRRTRTTSLRPHNDSYGTPCRGRRGRIVGRI